MKEDVHNIHVAATHDIHGTKTMKFKVRADDPKDAKRKVKYELSRRFWNVNVSKHQGIVESDDTDVNEGLFSKKVPIHKRVEPTMDGKKAPVSGVKRGAGGKFQKFDNSAPEVKIKPKADYVHPVVAAAKNKSSERIEPHMDKSGSAGSHSTTGKHVLTINHDNSVTHTNPKGDSRELHGAMKTSSAHMIVSKAVKDLHGGGEAVHVKDASGKWSKRMEKTHPHIEKGILQTKNRPTHSMHTWSESQEIDEIMADKFAPKKLKDIIVRPARKWSEYDGNTEDEQSFVKKHKDAGEQIADRNGNGDEVFRAANIKRNEKPVVPGEDEKKYADWNGDVKNVEEARAVTTSKPSPITHDHLDQHWATQHVAPQGSKISKSPDGESAIIHHPSGEIHHIHSGLLHQSDFDYGKLNRIDNKSSKTHAEAGKYNVIKHNYNREGTFSHQFVAAKKHGGAGNILHTPDESKAKEFQTKEHAENHINHHSQWVDHGVHFTAHEKRNPAQVKAQAKKSKDLRSKAVKTFHDAANKWVSSGGKSEEPHNDPKYHSLLAKSKKLRHPGIH